MSEFKLVVFDCDGVIIDSEIIYVKSLQEHLKKYGEFPTVDEIGEFIGSNSQKIAIDIINNFQLECTWQQFVTEHKPIYEKWIANNEIKLIDGVREFMQKLKCQNIDVAVASSSSTSYVRSHLDSGNLLEFVDFHIGRDQVKNTKPSPEIYLRTFEEFNVKPDEVLIIEDSVNGIKSGLDSGAYVCGFKGGSISHNTSAADDEVWTFSEIHKKYFVR